MSIGAQSSFKLHQFIGSSWIRYVQRDVDWGGGGGSHKADPPFVHEKLMEPTPNIAWTKVFITRYTVHGTCGKTWCTILQTKGQNMLQWPSITFLDTRYEHRMRVV